MKSKFICDNVLYYIDLNKKGGMPASGVFRAIGPFVIPF